MAQSLLYRLAVDARIDIEASEGNAVARIAGRLSATACRELREACRGLEGRLILNLSDLIFADEDGVNTLRALMQEGAEVQGDSPLIRLLIQPKDSGSEG